MGGEMSKNGLSDKILQHFAENCGKADWPVVGSQAACTLLEDRRHH